MNGKDQIVWRPGADRVRASRAREFIDRIAAVGGQPIADFDALYDFSVREPNAFWREVMGCTGVISSGSPEPVIADRDQMPGARFFPNVRLNFAENLLRRRDDADAVVFWGEDRYRKRFSYAQLYDGVSVLRQALAASGVGPGDRVAGFLPNVPESIVAMLATTSLGATWTSCSPDFGERGVLDRFGQTRPKVLFAATGYVYNGKYRDCSENLAVVVGELDSVEQLVLVPYVNGSVPDSLPGALTLENYVSGYSAEDIQFAHFPFDHPIYIMYSSGTTGAPKCIVHGAGGTLIEHLKEMYLHCDIKRNDRVFYFTTLGWMMWNWLVSALACEATLLLYDGSPFYPDGNVLFDYAATEKATFFGTSAKYIDSLKKNGFKPRETHNLSSMKTLASTGSPLAAESFDYVYRDIKTDVHLASISGGTDIIGCFMLGDPTSPVYRGEIQTRSLGLAVDVFDDNGHSVRAEKGDLVCTQPFPSMPVSFWNDPGDTRYRAAYFEQFPGVWTHGDYVEMTTNGGFVIYGRSDATLNPGGVRIGTAEIYRQVEQMDEIIESVVVGQDFDSDTRVVLFVVLAAGVKMSDELVTAIKSRIRKHCTPRHVPACVLQVNDIPRTKSGKLTELAVRDVIHGRAVKNLEALANPDALKEFANRPELARA